jgi:hypothetical protein
LGAHVCLSFLSAHFRAGQAAPADTLSIKAQLWRDGDKGGITLSQDHMKAGPVEFVVTNTSTDPVNGKVHEFLITPSSGAIDGLRYDSPNSVVLENKLAKLEGLEDMLPSATATMRLVLRPGEQPAAPRLQIGNGAVEP